MKQIIVRFSNGERYSIPARFIAKNRAEYYAKLDSGRGDGDYREVFDRELKYTLASNTELLDWATGNMNWTDVATAATQLPREFPTTVTYQTEWSDVDNFTIVDE